MNHSTQPSSNQVSELARRVEQLSQLIEVSESVAAQLELNPLLQHIVDAATQVLNAEMDGLLVLSEDEEHLDALGTRRDPKAMWLAWIGEGPPLLKDWWALYFCRFHVDHWYRFAKQRLHWTLARFGTPEQAERWSVLMPLITWELWLAREGGGGSAAAVAEATDPSDPWSCLPGNGRRFSRNSHTRPRAQTPRKIARLAERASTQAPGALFRGAQGPKAEEKAA